MKKIFSIILVLSISISIFNFSVSAQGTNDDPYYDFHLQVSYYVDQLRQARDNKIELLQKEIETYREESLTLYEQANTYSTAMQNEYELIINKIDDAENKISTIKADYFNDVDEYLAELGYIKTEETESLNSIDYNIHTSATSAGYMQTHSSVSYNANTKEFYYFVEYDYYETNILGAYVGLNDAWGDYDLVSMQHKDATAWNWNNIIVTANLAYARNGNSLAGKADKYSILSTGLSGAAAVSNRYDFWNGSIFNIKDAQVSASQNFSSEIRYVTLEGWLKVNGTVKSTLVKSEYEHNYSKLLATVSVKSASLDNIDFGMEVSYTKSSGSWPRSAGSRPCNVLDYE